MNEELQSTNDELHTINDMLRERGAELESAQAFIASLINSVHLAMMVVDREMRVVVWNRGAEELWGVRTDEAVGTPLSLLDIGLPFDLIRPLIGQAFVDPTQTAEATVDAVNRRGRATSLRVTASSFQSGDEVVDGALLLMEPSS